MLLLYEWQFGFDLSHHALMLLKSDIPCFFESSLHQELSQLLTGMTDVCAHSSLFGEMYRLLCVMKSLYCELYVQIFWSHFSLQ